MGPVVLGPYRVAMTLIEGRYIQTRVRLANQYSYSSQEKIYPSSFSSNNVQVLPVMFRTVESFWIVTFLRTLLTSK